MAKLFRQNQTPLSPHDACRQKYQMARSNLLAAVIFTAVNLVLLVTNSNTYFLFSAFIPYFIATMGMLFCGRFPQEFYTDGLENVTLIDGSYFIIIMIVAVAITLLYLLAWYMSAKNRVGWLIFALVFFIIDTLVMLYMNGISFEIAFDILFHLWVIYYMITGISSHYKLQKLPPEQEPMPPLEEFPQYFNGDEQNF